MTDLQFSVLILAAGNSERMGRSKAMLSYGNGLTFAGQLISSYHLAGIRSIVMVVNDRSVCSFPDEDKVRMVLNRNVERGRSWSIRLGLQHIPAQHACFIHNIDNPVADAGLMQKMMSALQPCSYVVPVFEGKGGHPVLLGSDIVDQLRKQQDLPDLRSALGGFDRIEVVSPDDRILLNINTPEDYRRFIHPG